MNKTEIRKLLRYMLRWQLSTPVLALCIYFIPFGSLINTVIANLIGALMFYEVDKWIFKHSHHEEEHVKKIGNI